jgi:hypothetical protein
MKIQILSKNSEYGFGIVSDDGKALFFSPVQYFLISDIKPSYKYAWEAYRDARSIIFNKPYHLAGETVNEDSSVTNNPMTTTQLSNVSAEQMLSDHYMNVLDGMKEKCRSSKKDKIYGNKVYQEIKLIMKEIETIAGKLTDSEDKLKMRRILGRYKKVARKYFPDLVKKDEDEARNKASNGSTPPDLPTPQEAQQLNSAPPSPDQSPLMGKNNRSIKIGSLVDPEKDNMVDSKKELMDEYASRICLAIQDKHKSAYCHYDSPEDDELVIMENEKPILKVRINIYMHVDNIAPIGNLQRMYPVHSVKFYQRYWKPIVESLNHFCTINPPILIEAHENSLPDSGETRIIKGWNIENREREDVEVNSKGENSMWTLSSAKNIKVASKENSSNYTEQQYLNAIVRCIDPKLDSIFQRTGSVIQVIPETDAIEIDVDFGRGLGTVRLTEKQIEIVPV